MHLHESDRARELRGQSVGLDRSFAAVPLPAAVALQRLAGNAAVSRLIGESRQRNHPADALNRPHPAPQGLIVQRALLVGGEDVGETYQQSTGAGALSVSLSRDVLDATVGAIFSDMRSAVESDFSEEEQQRFEEKEEEVRWQLKKIIVNPVGDKGYHPVLEKEIGRHPDFGRKNHSIHVNDYTELARNLLGWVGAKANRRAEKDLAQAVQGDPGVELLLNVVLRRIDGMASGFRRRIPREQAKRMKYELRTCLSHIDSQGPEKDDGGNIVPGGARHDPKNANRPVGSYIEHFGFNSKYKGSPLETSIVENGGLLEVLRNPEDFDFRDKVIALHDLMQYFGHDAYTPDTAGKGMVDDIRAEEGLSTTEVDENGYRTKAAVDRGQMWLKNPPAHVRNHQPSTRDESSPTTRLARSRNVPVWSGQSYTAGRMFKTARRAGATAPEIAAVALSIFSFWRINFDHTTEFAYHTLHEVMDIAQNFGVPYSIDDRYLSIDMVTLENIFQRLEDMQDEVAEMCQVIERQIAELRESLQGVDADSVENSGKSFFIQGMEQTKVDLQKICETIDDLFTGDGELSANAEIDRLTSILDKTETVGSALERVSKRLAHGERMLRKSSAEGVRS